MLFMCTTKFDMKSEQLSLIDEYLTTQEIQSVREEKDTQKGEHEFDPISDGEDEPSAATSQSIQPISEHALGKRPRVQASTDEYEPLIKLDEENEMPLPNNSHMQVEGSTKRRSSGRLPNRLRQDKDFVYEKP